MPKSTGPQPSAPKRIALPRTDFRNRPEQQQRCVSHHGSFSHQGSETNRQKPFFFALSGGSLISNRSGDAWWSDGAAMEALQDLSPTDRHFTSSSVETGYHNTDAELGTRLSDAAKSPHGEEKGLNFGHNLPEDSDHAAHVPEGSSFQKLLVLLAAEHNRCVSHLRNELIIASSNNSLVQRSTSQGTTHGKRDSAGGPSLASLPAFSKLSLGEGTTAAGRLSPFDIDRTEGGHIRPRSTCDEGGTVVDKCRGAQREIKKLLDPKYFREHLLNSQNFDVVSSVAIILNAMLYGWMANESVTAALEGRHPDDITSSIQHLTYIFTAWFMIELLVRIKAAGLQRFCQQDDWSWNLFDMVVVGTDVILTFIDLALQEGEGGAGGSSIHNLTVVRMLRILRITRALRILRLMRFFRELRMMVFSILHSGSALTWSLVILAATIYVFGVYFIQVVAYHVHAGEHSEQDLQEIRESFGNLLRVEYSLYQAVSGGISWGELSKILEKIHPAHAVVFCFFTFFTIFAIVNIITGIFVETSINSARSRQEEIAQEQLRSTAGLVEDMKRHFEKADTNGSGTITLAEFENYLDAPEVSAYLTALGIEVDKARALFELLDLEATGEITVDEFTFGCLRLKGGAKSIDLATLMNHTKRMSEQWRSFFRWSERQFLRLHEFEMRVEERLSFFCFDHADDEEVMCPPAPPTPLDNMGREQRSTNRSSMVTLQPREEEDQ